ncbi:MAG: TIGR00341 family protein [Cytophagales bacterium]|nr:TIGR00341 family protein [Cytophagales bacterium]
MKQIWKEIKGILHRFLDLESDRASYNEIIENIEKGVDFRGTNLWILIFAILVASVGLNVNSTAVVIGAMLISPLMGPIMGIGLGVGIYDFILIKKSFKSLMVAVLISVLSSAVYFALTPLSDAQSELLARTTPTIWDVFIAFFGGLAGIVAVTRKEKSNAIPGVAIATALMPPLCTAGYGLATLNFSYFFGAFYLFFINSVFISVSSMIIIRFMRIPSKEWVDASQQRKMRTSVVAVAIITMVPSIYMGYDIVKRSIFNRNANDFITNEFQYNDTRVIEQVITPKDNSIEVFLYGSPLESYELTRLNNELGDYGLKDAKLTIRQNQQNFDVPDAETMRTGIIEDLYRKNEELIKNKDEKIALLEKELGSIKIFDQIQADVCAELEVQYPEVQASAFSTMKIHPKEGKVDTVTMVYLDTKTTISRSRLAKMEEWLKLRLKTNDVKIVQQ